MINFLNIFQGIGAAAAVGYIVLNFYQNRDLVSSDLSPSEMANKRIVYGLLIYTAYYASLEAVNHYVHANSFVKFLYVVGSTAILIAIGMWLYWLYLKKHRKVGNSDALSPREKAFYIYDSNGELRNIRIDIFSFSGDHVASGYLVLRDSSPVYGNMLLQSLGDSDYKVKEIKDVKDYDNIFLDAKNSMVIYITYSCHAEG